MRGDGGAPDPPGGAPLGRAAAAPVSGPAAREAEAITGRIPRSVDACAKVEAGLSFPETGALEEAATLLSGAETRALVETTALVERTALVETTALVVTAALAVTRALSETGAIGLFAGAVGTDGRAPGAASGAPTRHEVTAQTPARARTAKAPAARGPVRRPGARGASSGTALSRLAGTSVSSTSRSASCSTSATAATLAEATGASAATASASASESSAADWKRDDGSRDAARSHHASNPGGTSGAIAVGTGRGSERICTHKAPSWSRSKGRRPARHSKAITPRLQRSER